MKKKTFNKYIILILCCSIGVTIGVLSHKLYNKYIDYKDSSKYFEKVYIKDPTTSNLIKLCDSYLENNNIKYLDYVDKLLDAEDYEQAVLDYYKNDSDFVNDSYIYKNVHLISTMYVCAVNNDIDKFLSSIEKYYPQLPLSAKLTCFHNAMLKLNTPFLTDNIDVIVNKMYSIISETDPPANQFVDLLSVLAYYQVADKNNPQVEIIRNKIQKLELTDKDIFARIQEESMKTYMYYWTDLLIR